MIKKILIALVAVVTVWGSYIAYQLYQYDDAPPDIGQYRMGTPQPSHPQVNSGSQGMTVTSTGTLSSTGMAINSWSILVDEFVHLKEVNPEFAQANILSLNGDYTGAIEQYQKAKTSTATPEENAVIDFGIASTRFSLDRSQGTRDFLILAHNEAYPKRTRALALARIDLLSRKYNDTTILHSLATELQIPWTNQTDFNYAYAKKIYDLYPLPTAAYSIMHIGMSRAPNEEEAKKIYDLQLPIIENGIEKMRHNPWELTEATSTLLGLANAKAMVVLKWYTFVSTGSVESAYEDLIQFDQEKKLDINQQYTFLAYANYLAGEHEYSRVAVVLSKLFEWGLSPIFTESLPKTTLYPYLKAMPIEGLSTDIVNLIGLIARDVVQK